MMDSAYSGGVSVLVIRADCPSVSVLVIRADYVDVSVLVIRAN